MFNGFEIGCILLAVALYLIWLSTPDESPEEKDAREFKQALLTKRAAQQKEHGRRVEARKKANPFA